MTDLVYGRAAPVYRAHGWQGVLPLPEGQKAHPPSGFTGTTGADPTDAQVLAWCEDLPNGNIALRLPEGVIGIDIDAYLDKHGDVSLLALEATLGTLPATWRSTSREVLRKSGIYLFRVPPGRYHDKPAPNIEVIQHHHRYVVVMPSIHPEGRPYFWYDATDTEQRRPPRIEELAVLPEAWVEHLREKPRADGEHAQRRPHPVDDWTPAVTKAFTRALMEMAGGRHDATLTAVMALARLDRLEHPGAAAAMGELGQRFRAAITDRSTPKQADKEWADMVDGAYEIADSTPATAPKWDATWKPGADPNWRPWWDDPEQPAPEPSDQSPDLIDVISSVDPDYEWLIPSLIECGDRVIITGPEGKGKSTLLRQMGVQIASGWHPFSGDCIDPVNILLVDCENSQRQVRRKLGPLYKIADGVYEQGRMRFEFRTDGLDLCRNDDRAWLAERIQTDETQLLIIGPLYKLQSGDPKDEETARMVALYLDSLRQNGLAMIIEAHSPYADGSNKRVTRPYGASLWSRWPEFGIHLAEDGTITHWRGQREEREWPTKLERGTTTWPWIVGQIVEEDTPWEGPKQCMLAVRAYMEQVSPEERSLTKLKVELRARNMSYRDSIFAEAAERLVNEGKLQRRKGPRNAVLYSFAPDAASGGYPYPDEPF